MTHPETSVNDKKKTEAVPPATTPQQADARKRPDPTRYGDWELNGKCVDF